MIKLSICIATFNRGAFIAETLDSILSQMTPDTELIVVNGNSPDETNEVVLGYADRFPQLRYFRESTNSGVDGDYDKAVGYAVGTFCWLMTDDDIMLPGAIASVLERISMDQGLDAVIVNAEVRNVDLTRLLERRLLVTEVDTRYEPGGEEQLFAKLARHLKFIGCVVVRRAWWLSRDRAKFYGSLFIHVGAIFQSPPLANCYVMAKPLLSIRYGNAMWTARGFEIWMFLWPNLVWSFAGFSDGSKSSISQREPWRRITKLGMHRATGGYSIAEYHRFLANRTSRMGRVVPYMMAVLPARFINALASVYCVLLFDTARLNLYDLARSRHSSWVTRIAAKVVGV